MPFTIVRQDITKLNVDAIVNAANTDLQMGGGVCLAIFKAAGADKLQAACKKYAPIKTGEAVITPGFDLLAKYVIHAAGPVYNRLRKAQSKKYLYAAYTNSLKLAVESKCESVAFPLISSGIYGYPKDEALQVATSAIKAFLGEHDIDITLAVFDKSSFSVSRELIGAVESYVDEHTFQFLRKREILDVERQAMREVKKSVNVHREFRHEEMPAASVYINDARGGFFGNLDESFSKSLLRLIDAKGKTDVEVYKRANLSRKLFSKIRSNEGYMPSKRTAIALAIALELSLDETGDLLKSAGYALSHAVQFDVIVEYFIVNGKYDIFLINEVLFEYDQALLGA